MITPLRHDRSTRPIGWAMIGVSVAELVAVELLVPWPTVRLVLLVLGVLSLIGVVWLVVRQGRRPHLVTPEALVLRAGLSGEVRLPWAAIEAVTTRQRAEARDGVGLDGDAAVLAVSTTTNLEVRLRAPQTLDATSAKALTGATVTSVRFWADDPRGALDAVSSALASPLDPPR